MIAPRVPTSIALGPQDNTLNANNGALFFIQVSAVAQGNAEIAVSENGVAKALYPAIGLAMVRNIPQSSYRLDGRGPRT